MNKSLVLTLLSVGCLLCNNAVTAAGWSGSANILEIYPAPGNNGILIKHGSMPNPDSCTSPGYYVLDKNNLLFTEIYSLLMSAQARKSNINLQLVGCKGYNNTHPSIFQVIAK